MKKILFITLALIMIMGTLVGCANAKAIDTSYMKTDTINGVAIPALNGYQYDAVNEVYLLDFTLTWGSSGDVSIQKIKETSKNFFEVKELVSDVILLTRKTSIHWIVPVETLDDPELIKELSVDASIDASIFNFNFLIDDEIINNAEDGFEWLIEMINNKSLEPSISFEGNTDHISAMTRVDTYEVSFDGDLFTIRVETPVK